jgi:hypothetical protein
VKRALALILCVFPAYASPPFLPIATCDKGVCTMTQKDYEAFQQFHVAVYQATQEMQEHMKHLERENGNLRGLIAKNLHCQLGRKI